MIHIDMRAPTRSLFNWRVKAFVCGREVREVFVLWALWNGGPGFVRYYRRGADGSLTIIDGQVKSRIRFGISVRLRGTDDEEHA